MAVWDTLHDQIQKRQSMVKKKPPNAAGSQQKATPTLQRPQNAQPVRSAAPNRSRRKYRIRYDRILLVLLLLIALICLLVFGVKSCSSSGEDNPDGTGASAVTTTTITTEPVQMTLALTAEDIHKGDLIIVNEDHAYMFAADDITLETVYEGRNTCYGVSDMEVSLDANVIDRFNQLMQAYYNIYENRDIMVISGYRTKDTQAELYESKKTMLPGGYSDYHTARSFDLVIYPDGASSNYYAPTGDYAWIAEHAAEYGFILRYPDGKADKTGISPRAYTFRYVGVPHANYIYQNGICLEEYIEKIKDYAADNPLIVETKSGEWAVFYAPANSAGSTQIALPQGASYTVSGDNMNGFVIAYQEKQEASSDAVGAVTSDMVTGTETTTSTTTTITE